MQKRRRLLNDDVENCVEDIVDQIEEEHRATPAWIKEHNRFVYKQRGSINLQMNCECAFWFENDSDYCCDQTCTVQEPKRRVQYWYHVLGYKQANGKKQQFWIDKEPGWRTEDCTGNFPTTHRGYLMPTNISPFDMHCVPTYTANGELKRVTMNLRSTKTRRDNDDAIRPCSSCYARLLALNIPELIEYRFATQEQLPMIEELCRVHMAICEARGKPVTQEEAWRVITTQHPRGKQFMESKDADIESLPLAMQIEVLKGRVTKCEEALKQARDELGETEGIQNCLLYS